MRVHGLHAPLSPNHHGVQSSSPSYGLHSYPLNCSVSFIEAKSPLHSKGAPLYRWIKVGPARVCRGACVVCGTRSAAFLYIAASGLDRIRLPGSVTPGLACGASAYVK